MDYKVKSNYRIESADGSVLCHLAKEIEGLNLVQGQFLYNNDSPISKAIYPKLLKLGAITFSGRFASYKFQSYPIVNWIKEVDITI